MREIQSLARGLKILDMLAGAQDSISITSVAAELQIDKGSASLLLQTLANYGFAEKDLSSRQYRLGPAVVRLSRSLLTKMPLRETAKPFLHQLVRETSECAHLGVLAQGKVLYIDQVESPETLRVNAEVGFTAPLHCTALGKVLLAWGDAPIPAELSTYTARTICDVQVLQMDLEKTRWRGYALDDEEFDYGVRCIAAPVFDYCGKAVGALGISGPAARVRMDRISELSGKLMAIAKALSDKMSFK